VALRSSNLARPAFIVDSIGHFIGRWRDQQASGQRRIRPLQGGNVENDDYASANRGWPKRVMVLAQARHYE
jgi:hypothetical protein